MRKVMIVGSARKDGDTWKLVEEANHHLNCDIVDLQDFKITHFDYEHRNKNDDFLPLLRRIIADYDMLILVTPVYWYAMSGLMKVFFDRLTDVLTLEKELGRRLRGKEMAVMSSSNGNHLGESFWLPFSASAAYLGMTYRGNMHTIASQDSQKEIAAFVRTL